MSRCPACGSAVSYSPEAYGDICTSCGLLLDQQQIQLYTDTSADLEAQSGRAYYAGPTTLMNASGARVLNGQSGKEHHDRVNRESMHRSIQSLLSSLNHPGLTPRAKNVFDLAMAEGKYKWGKTAKLVSGASVAIALRESERSETLGDIAARLDVQLPSLTRAFIKIKTILSLDLPPNDAVLHFPNLLKFLATLISSPKSTFPKALQTYLSRISISAVSRQATAISALTQRISLTDQRQVPPVACALLIFAIEAETGKAMPNHDHIAKAFSGQIAMAHGTILERYREVGRLFDDWKGMLPWADDMKDAKRGKNKRETNARWAKDVVTFQDELWRAANGVTTGSLENLEVDEHSSFISGEEYLDEENIQRPSKRRRLDTEITPEPFADDDDDKLFEGWLMPSYLCRTKSNRPEQYIRPVSQPLATHRRALDRAAMSLLSPHGTPPPAPRTPKTTAPSAELRRDLLAGPSFFSANFIPPTRLSFLAAERGGEQNIDEDELFEEGEMERILRSEEEVQVMREERDWDILAEDEGDLGGGEEDDKEEKSDEWWLDVDAPKGIEGMVDGQAGNSWEMGLGLRMGLQVGEERVLGEWRPVSP